MSLLFPTATLINVVLATHITIILHTHTHTHTHTHIHKHTHTHPHTNTHIHTHYRTASILLLPATHSLLSCSWQHVDMWPITTLWSQFKFTIGHTKLKYIARHLYTTHNFPTHHDFNNRVTNHISPHFMLETATLGTKLYRPWPSLIDATEYIQVASL